MSDYCWINRSAIREHGRLLGSDGVAILMVISCCLNDKTMLCFPSQAHIARTLGISKITVNRYLKVLEVAGFIERDLKSGVKTYYKLTQPIGNIEVSSGLVLNQNEAGVISTVPLVVSPQYRINHNITNRNNTNTGVCVLETSTKQQINKTQKSGYTPEFEAWWAIYPARGGQKHGKKLALSQFLKIKDKSLIMDATKAYAKSDRAIKGFAQDPHRFLKNEDLEAWRGQKIDSKPIVDGFDRYRNQKPEDLA